MPYLYQEFKSRMLAEDMHFTGGQTPGEDMPDFDLITTDGTTIKKSDYVGNRPLLITFASVTCPMTRSASPVLKRLYKEFGYRVDFLTLYVREVHPGGNFPQPNTFEEKMRYAKVYKERDEIPWPVAVDDLNGTLHRKLGTKPNAAYLMNPDGKVAFRSLWSNNETALRNALIKIVWKPDSIIGQNEQSKEALIAGSGKVNEVLRFSGRGINQDVLRRAMQGRMSGLLKRISAIAGILGAIGGIFLLIRSKKTPEEKSQ